MTSSGIKRGVASVAVSALAVAGLPFLASSASAEPNAAQYADDTVELLTQHTGLASTKNDGTDTTVRLEAGAAADVSSVIFQYSLDNGATWVDIATVTRNDDGAFSHEWNASALAGAVDVDLRAQSVNPTTANPDDFDERLNVDIVGGGAATESVNLATGTQLGYFAAPYSVGPNGTYVGLTGTTSATAGTVQLQYFDGATGEPVDGDTAPVDVASGASTGTFAGVFDLEAVGYSFVGSPDEVTLGAERDSDDAEAFTLYQQEIGTVTADPTTVNQPGGSGPAEITVTVLDQNGNPIANAEVRPSNTGIVDPDVEYTDGNGEAVFDQDSGTSYYYANQTDGDTFEPTVGDERSADVTVTPFTPVPTSIQGNSRDGEAFDFDENTNGLNGDIQVQVEDQNGGATATDPSQTLNYHWVITPFAGGTPTRVPGTGESTATPTGDPGEYDIVFPTGQAEGTYQLFASLSERTPAGGGNIAESSVLTVKAGESTVVYDEASPEISPSGGTEEVTGSLQLDDGTGLGGRDLQFALDAAGPGENAALEENSGTVNDGIITTAADGGFAFNVVDQVQSPQPSERRSITVTGDPGTVDNDSVGNDVQQGTQDVVFASDEAPAGSEITLGGDTGTDTAGDVKDVTVNVDDTVGPGGAPVANTLVTLSTDEGFFTDVDGTTDLGQEITVATDDTGFAEAYLTIERNEGFDDDGEVTSVVTATSGDATDTEEYFWTSANPNNGGEVDIFFSEDQTVTVLPLAPWETENVCMDVIVTDEFGNPVEGELVEITSDDGEYDFGMFTDVNDNCDFTVEADEAGDVAYTATWDAPSDATPPVTEDLTDEITVEWYDIEVTDVSLTNNGDEPMPVGSTVTMTYKAVDQNGEPIDGYTVEFYRTGPDNTHDGDLELTRQTNDLGEAYYVFQGETAGTAVVTTVLYDTFDNILPAGEATDEVSFGGQPIVAKLKGKNNGGKDDKLKVVAPAKAAGAAVQLFKIKKNGNRVLVKSANLNNKGDKKFTVKDQNGKKKTKYIAKVKATSGTTADTTNQKAVK